MSKIKLPPDKLKDLEGFEDIFDIVDLDGKKNKGKVPDTYDITSFLENEEQRLASLDKLFSKKIPNMVNYPQTEILIKKQTEEKDILLDELRAKLLTPNSPFLKKMENVFDSYFGNSKSID